MKTKHIICILLLGVFSTYMFAQDESSSYSTPKKPKIWIGPKFGTDFVGVPTSVDVLEAGIKQQWQAGVLMQFGRTLYLQPEAYYCLDNIVPASEGVEASSTASIKIPALLGLRFLNLGLVSLHVMGGPQWTLPMKDSDGNSTGSISRDWLVGAGVDLLGFITADVRYIYDPSIQLNEHITGFDPLSTPLNVTVGFKFR